MGEENLVFIGKKKVEKLAAAESGACQDPGVQGNPPRAGLYRLGLLLTQLSLPCILPLLPHLSLLFLPCHFPTGSPGSQSWIAPHGFLSKSMDICLPNISSTTVELSEVFVGFSVVRTEFLFCSQLPLRGKPNPEMLSLALPQKSICCFYPSPVEPKEAPDETDTKQHQTQSHHL